MKAKVLDDAFWKLVSMWPKSLQREEIGALLLSVYEAGQLDVSDLDAARWRLLESSLGDVKAKFDHYIALVPPRRSLVPFDASHETIHIHKAVKWRFECIWNDASGSADTIPKLINLLLTERRNAAKEQS